MIENRFGPVADLITYEDSYSVMETYEDYRTLCGWDIPLTGNAVIVQGEGKITLGFNLENVKPEVDGNVIKVNLPAPEIKSNYLEPMKFIENNNILNPLSAEETNQKFMAEKNYKLKEAIDKGYQFMQVKTVKAGVYEEYDITNLFYRSLGFKEFEVIEEIWGEDNPCQIYVMSLR